MAHGDSPIAALRRRLSDPGRADRPAFIEGSSGTTRTWADLDRVARRWTAAAGHLGRERRIGLLIVEPLDLLAAYLGALAAGVAVAPLNPVSTPAEMRSQCAALGLAAVVTDSDDVPLPAEVERWDLELGGPRTAVPAPAPAAPARDVALIMASSGTTGTPKIVPLDLARLWHTATAVARSHELGPDDRGYCPLPLFHINALVVGVLTTVVTGGSLVVERRFSARSFWSTADRCEVTWLNLVPAILTVLGQTPLPAAGVPERIAFARSASAPLPEAVRRRFEDRTGIGVIETYGMTEAGSQITANPREPARRRPGTVGLPVGIELRVVDLDARPLPARRVGEVALRGDSVVTEYWSPVGADGQDHRRPAVSAEGWLATGDLGHLDEDGYLTLVGRSDDVINRGGEKVFPREIEELLLADPDVDAAVVVGRPHSTVGEEPVAFVTRVAGSSVGGPALTDRLMARCHSELSRFKRPADLTVVASLPAGPTGKVRRAEVRNSLTGAGGPTDGRSPARVS